MKKIFKIILIIFIGIALVYIGYLLGGDLPNNLFGKKIFDRKNNSNNLEYGGKMDFDNYTKLSDEEIKKLGISLDGIEGISISSKIAELNIHSSATQNNLSYSLTNMEEKYFSVRVIDNKIVMEDKTPKKRFLNFSIQKNNAPKVNITVPQNFNFNTFAIKLGIGELNLNNIICDEFFLNSGVGESNIENLTVKKSAKIKAGVGELNSTDCNINNMSAESGMGEFSFSGKLTGKSVIQAGMGECNLEIYGNADDYNIKTKAGIGGIKINGKGSNSISPSFNTAKENAKHSLEVKSGIGEISINFKN